MSVEDWCVAVAVTVAVAVAVNAVEFAAFLAVNPGGSFIFLLLVVVDAEDADAEEAFFVVVNEAVDVLLPCLRLTLRLDFLFFGMLLLSAVEPQRFVCSRVVHLFVQVVCLFVLVSFVVLVLCGFH